MKKTIILISDLIIFNLNFFIFKVGIIHLVSALVFLIYPLLCFVAFKKKEGKTTAIIIWMLALIPTGLLLLMSLPFGFPPDGFSPMDLFKHE